MLQLTGSLPAPASEVLRIIAPRHDAQPSAPQPGSFAQQLQERRAEVAPLRTAANQEPPVNRSPDGSSERQAREATARVEQAVDPAADPAPGKPDGVADLEASGQRTTQPAEESDARDGLQVLDATGLLRAGPASEPASAIAAPPAAPAVEAPVARSDAATGEAPVAVAQPRAGLVAPPVRAHAVAAPAVQETAPADSSTAQSGPASHVSASLDPAAQGLVAPGALAHDEQGAPVGSAPSKVPSTSEVDPQLALAPAVLRRRQDRFFEVRAVEADVAPLRSASESPAVPITGAAPQPDTSPIESRRRSTPVTIEQSHLSAPAPQNTSQASAPAVAVEHLTLAPLQQDASPRAASSLAAPQQQSTNESQSLQAAASRGLSAALRQSGGSVTLRLSPATLGALRVSLQINGNAVALHLETGGGRAHELLTQHVASLRAGLEQHGLKVEEVTTRIAPELARPQEPTSQSHNGMQTSREREAPSDPHGRSSQQDHRQDADPRDRPTDEHGLPDQDDSIEEESAFAQLHNVMLRLDAVA